MSFRIGGHVMCVLDMRRCVNLWGGGGGCKIWRDFSVSPACAWSGKMRQFCVQCMLDLNETSSLLGVCSQPGRVKMPGEISEQFLCLLWKWNGQLERDCATDHQAACVLERILQMWTKGPKAWDMSTFSDSWMCVSTLSFEPGGARGTVTHVDQGTQCSFSASLIRCFGALLVTECIGGKDCPRSQNGESFFVFFFWVVTCQHHHCGSCHRFVISHSTYVGERLQSQCECSVTNVVSHIEQLHKTVRDGVSVQSLM